MRRSLALARARRARPRAGIAASGADFTGALQVPGQRFTAAADFNTVAVSVTDPGRRCAAA